MQYSQTLNDENSILSGASLKLRSVLINYSGYIVVFDQNMSSSYRLPCMYATHSAIYIYIYIYIYILRCCSHR